MAHWSMKMAQKNDAASNELEMRHGLLEVCFLESYHSCSNYFDLFLHLRNPRCLMCKDFACLRIPKAEHGVDMHLETLAGNLVLMDIVDGLSKHYYYSIYFCLSYF